MSPEDPCFYCGAVEATTIDHVIPRVQNGSDDPGNLVRCCLRCNSSKGGRTPAQWTATKLRQALIAAAHMRNSSAGQLALQLPPADRPAVMQPEPKPLEITPELRTHIRDLVAQAPPLSETQRARALALLRPGIEATT